MPVFSYDRERAVAYARRWALDRNPRYHNFVGLGGDCTNFISQCVYAGACQMDYRNTFGWYYISLNSRSPAWTGVPFLHKYLMRGDGVGPFASEVSPGDLQPGDVIQLGRADGSFFHSLLVTERTPEGYLVAAHSDDVLDQPLSSYEYDRARYLHIEGVRADARPVPCL